MHLVVQVLSAAQVFEKEAHRVFKPHGLTPAQFNVLMLLSRQPNGMRASDLARELVVDPSNVTGLLKRMKQVNLLKELENTGDRRQHRVGWTPKGRAAWLTANHDYEKSLAKLNSAVSPRNRKIAEIALQQLTAAVASLR